MIGALVSYVKCKLNLEPLREPAPYEIYKLDLDGASFGEQKVIIAQTKNGMVNYFFYSELNGVVVGLPRKKTIRDFHEIYKFWGMV